MSSNNNKNLISNLPKLYNGMLNPVFNVADFQQTNATTGDLANYANLYADNAFIGSNSFFGITVQSINNISSTVLGYLVNINENVQTALTSLQTSIASILTSLTGFSYDATNNVNIISNDVYVNSISTDNNGAIAGNFGVAGTLSADTITNQYLLSNKINCDTLTTNQINCSTGIQHASDIGCFLYVIIYIPSTGQTYTPTLLGIPMMKSQYISNMFVPTSPFQFIVTLKSGYSIYFYDPSNNLIGSLENTTDDFLYNRTFTFVVAPYKIALSLNGIILN